MALIIGFYVTSCMALIIELCVRISMALIIGLYVRVCMALIISFPVTDLYGTKYYWIVCDGFVWH